LRLTGVAAAALVLVGLVGGGVYYAAFAPRDLKMGAAAAWDEYNTDSKAANKKYAGKFVQMSGTIKVVTIDERDRYFFEAATDAPWVIECSFAKQQAEKVKNLQSGKEVTVRGRFTRRQGSDGNLMLTACEVWK
jgi:hypothetical protein